MLREERACMRMVRLPLWLIILTLVLALAGCGLSPTAETEIQHTSSSHSVSMPLVVTPTIRPARTAAVTTTPARLLIPAIGVNAFVESLGILPNGDLATPTRSP